MFDQIFQKPYTLKRHLNAPFLEDRLRYLNHCAEKGYALTVLQATASYQLVLVQYLPLEQNTMLSLEEITFAANRWALHAMQHYRVKNISYLSCKNRFIRHATQWLRFLGRLEMPVQPKTPTQITEFVDYMRNERGLAQETIRCTFHFLNRFFNQIKEEPSQFLSQLTPAHLDSFIINKFHQGTYAPITIRFEIYALRSFLRYAEYRGWCRPGISDSITAPRVYKYQTLPSSPSWDDVQRLLKTTEGDSPVNIRDRAILLLLTVYGLRDSEVRQLSLEDFDWKQKTFQLKHSKGGPKKKFPLVPTVEQSLIRYIKEVRPRNSTYREIFLTINAPFRPLKMLFAIVSRRWKPLDVAINHYGPHSLRHACATRLINQGVSLKTIADQLGHRNLDTTCIYAKVDLTRLREVANFNMGGLS